MRLASRRNPYANKKKPLAIATQVPPYLCGVAHAESCTTV
jgi:hypothetical protein